MEIIKIEGTHNTPSVRFDAEYGKIEIKGRSIPENPTEFFRPLVESLERFGRKPMSSLQVDVQFEYLNTSSTRAMFGVFKCLDAIQDRGVPVNVNWYYEDEDMRKIGENYQAVSRVKINMIQASYR